MKVPHGQQRDVLAVLLDELAEPGRGRAHHRVLDEHQGQQELVPRPHEVEETERGERGDGGREEDAGEGAPAVRAVHGGGLDQLLGQRLEVRTHPEDAEGHEQPDQRQDHGPVGVQQADRVQVVVERDHDGLVRQGQAEHQEREQRSLGLQFHGGQAVSGERREDEGDGYDAERDDGTRLQQGAESGRGPRGGEVPPLRVRRPGQAR